MPFPSQSTAGLFSRFGESSCRTSLDNQCKVMDKCGRVCNKCVDPFSKRLCLLSGKRVACGCDCRCKGKKCKKGY